MEKHAENIGESVTDQLLLRYAAIPISNVRDEFQRSKLYGIDLSFKCLGNCERRKKKFYGFGRLERTLIASTQNFQGSKAKAFN